MSAPPYNPNVDTKGPGEAPPPYPGMGSMPGPPPPGFNPPPTQPPNPYYPPSGQAAYPPPANYGYPQSQGNYTMHTAETRVYSVQPVNTTTVVMTGNCPRCHVGNLIEESNAAGLVCIILLVILFFPFGLLYLLCLPGATERRCPNCNYHSD